MFFGKILAQGQTYQFNTQHADQNQGEVLSLTNVVLAPTSQAPASLYIKKDSEEFLIASLDKSHPHATINVFISLLDEAVLSVKGNGILHITGFFEPEQEGGLPLEDELESDEEDEEEDEPVAPVSKAPVAQKKSVFPQQKPQSPQQKPQVAAKPVAQPKKAEPEED